MSEKKREWHSDRRAFDDHPKGCGHKQDSWICLQCADYQINYFKKERDALKQKLSLAREALQTIYKYKAIMCDGSVPCPPCKAEEALKQIGEA